MQPQAILETLLDIWNTEKLSGGIFSTGVSLQCKMYIFIFLFIETIIFNYSPTNQKEVNGP